MTEALVITSRGGAVGPALIEAASTAFIRAAFGHSVNTRAKKPNRNWREDGAQFSI
jgi:hypothetical protein